MNRPSLQLAFLTGPVNPRSAALDSEQTRFLERIAEPVGASIVPRDFPYPTITARWTPTPLWLASLRNVRNFLHARRSTEKTRAARASTLAMLAEADQTILFAGSCGLELLAGLSLDARWLSRILVIAYGPVARNPLPAVRLVTVRGRADFFSAVFFSKADHWVPGGHLGMLARPAFAELCARLVAREAFTYSLHS